MESITSDQIIQESYERQNIQKPSLNIDILDLQELQEYQSVKRKEFEFILKRNRLDLKQWIRYAQFEIEQHDMRRARSIFERALVIDPSYVPLWIRYIDCELKWKNINHARNLLDRCTNLMPRVDKLWYKYVLLEESLDHLDLVRGIYIKWCSLEPNCKVWDSFVDFEVRYKQFENARDVFTRYTMVHPTSDTWLKWIKFEMTYGNILSTRQIYLLSLDTLTSFDMTPLSDIENLIISFANWESSQQEFEFCIALYDIAISKWPHSFILKESKLNFEKKFGRITEIHDSIIYKRKCGYEAKLHDDSKDLDSWWLYLDLLQEYFPEELLSGFERAITDCKPITMVKNIQWKRYIYLWVRYLVYMELSNKEVSKIRELYKRLINDIIPHKHFTFGKIWIMFAKFEIRNNQLTQARKILGTSLGICPKPKLFWSYIGIEQALKEFDRVRKLYEKFINFDPYSLSVWMAYAELEENLGDEERSRGIYEIALTDEVNLPIKEKILVLQRYILFETDAGEYANARRLYEKLLSFNDYDPNCWISWALFESSIPSESQLHEYQQHLLNQETSEMDDISQEMEFEVTDENRSNTRNVFENALKHFKRNNNIDNRIMILNAMKNYEFEHGNIQTQEHIEKRMPSIVKLKKMEDGIEKELVEYIFPDDTESTENTKISKFLLLANKWNHERQSK